MSNLVIHFEDLLQDELDHEVFIRCLTNVKTRKDKIDVLIERYNEENASMEDPPLFDDIRLDKEEEFRICMEKLNILNGALQVSFEKGDYGMFTVLTSRVLHVSDRLNRLLLCYKGDARFNEAVKSVEITLANISKTMPSFKEGAMGPVVQKDMQNFSIQGTLKPIVQPSALGKHTGSKVSDVKGKNTSREVFDRYVNKNAQSSPMVVAQTDDKYDSLAEKVDKLTESFAQFLKASHAAGAVPKVPLNTFNVGSGNNRYNRVQFEPNLCPAEVRNLEFNPMSARNQNNRWAENVNVCGFQDMGNRRPNPNPIMRGPNRNVFEANNRHRRPIPINQWNIKFSGEDNSLSLSEFLGEVELYAESELFSNEELFASAVHLFTGYARKWYKANYWELTSWKELVDALKEEFQPEYYDFLLLSEIDARLQGKEESFSSFFAEMLILFGKLGKGMTEDHKIYILKKNMLRTYAVAIAAIDIVSVRQLAVICKRLDSTKQLQEQHQNVSQASFGRHYVEPSYKTPLQVRKPFRQQVNVVDLPDEIEDVDRGVREDVCAFRRREPRADFNGPRNQFPSNPRNVVCWNCDLPGHIFRTCQAERKVFCFICGFKNATVYTCPNCAKSNEDAAP